MLVRPTLPLRSCKNDPCLYGGDVGQDLGEFLREKVNNCVLIYIKIEHFSFRLINVNYFHFNFLSLLSCPEICKWFI